MQVTITPRYNDIFEGPRPTISDLLNGIPSMATLHLMCLLNAEFYRQRQGIELQERLFKLMTMRQPNHLVEEILQKARSRVYLNNGEEIAFFSTIYNIEFIHYELTHFRNGEIDQITPEQDLAILKAYFLIIEQVNNVYTKSLNSSHNLDDKYFYKMVWPTLLEQFELNQNTNPFTVMVKGLAFFNHLNISLSMHRMFHHFWQT